MVVREKVKPPVSCSGIENVGNDECASRDLLLIFVACILISILVGCACKFFHARRERRRARRHQSESLGISLDFILKPGQFQVEIQARVNQVEWRRNPNDGLPYTLGSFVQFYQGSLNEPPSEWTAAQSVET